MQQKINSKKKKKDLQPLFVLVRIRKLVRIFLQNIQQLN